MTLVAHRKEDYGKKLRRKDCGETDRDRWRGLAVRQLKVETPQAEKMLHKFLTHGLAVITKVRGKYYVTYFCLEVPVLNENSCDV
jgi:hypothetical protein